MNGDFRPGGPGITALEASGSVTSLPRPHSLAILSCGVGADQVLGAVLSSVRYGSSTAIAAFPDVRRGFCRLLCDRLSVECGLSISELTETQAHTTQSPCIVPAQYTARWSEAAPGGPIRIEAVEIEEGAEAGSRLRSACSSAITVFGGDIWLVVLAGMASNDIVEAARVVKNAGGRVSVQDEPTSLIWDAPRSVLQAGLSDEMLPLWGVSGLLGMAAEG
ncbi:MAG: hypothetical protein KatS3mg024_1648 [Armatimonadota bacterium]|nr:MAG: hypothetical protein KatS3mg024_1648 [Armatimonadota bacterium]